MTNIDKLNFRFIKAFQYFFDFNLQMKHKIDKFNIMSNIFFHFQTNMITTKKINILKVFYESFIQLCVDDEITKKFHALIYHITLIKLTNDFKKKLKKIYQNEIH